MLLTYFPMDLKSSITLSTLIPEQVAPELPHIMPTIASKHIIHTGQVTLSTIAKPVVVDTARVLKSPLHRASPQPRQSPLNFSPAEMRRETTTTKIV